jgi:hypothetical protein
MLRAGTGSLALMAPGARAAAPWHRELLQGGCGIPNAIGDNPSSGGTTAKLASALRTAAVGPRTSRALVTLADYFDDASGSKAVEDRRLLRKNGASTPRRS